MSLNHPVIEIEMWGLRGKFETCEFSGLEITFLNIGMISVRFFELSISSENATGIARARKKGKFLTGV